MLVILGIILLIMVVAVPAFTAITGTRSVEGGKNIVSAALTRARAEAIRTGQPAGVFFYVDPVSQRSAMAFVSLAADLSDPDPYDQYKSYAHQTDYQSSIPEPLGPDFPGAPPATADRVVMIARDFNGQFNPNQPGYANIRGRDLSMFRGRPIVLNYERRPTQGADQNPGSTGIWPDLDGDASDMTTFETVDWGPHRPVQLEMMQHIDPETLPAGVGLQVINEASIVLPLADSTFIDRYTRAGLVLFDGQGRLERRRYVITADSDLGRTLQLEFDLGSDRGLDLGRPAQPLRSQYGVVLYRQDLFLRAQRDGTARHYNPANPPTNEGDVIDDFQTTEADFAFFYPVPDNGFPSAFNEYAEERWLDANTVPLLVNRFSGQLVDRPGGGV